MDESRYLHRTKLEQFSPDVTCSSPYRLDRAFYESLMPGKTRYSIAQEEGSSDACLVCPDVDVRGDARAHGLRYDGI